MPVQEVANRLVALCTEGKYGEAIDELYSEDIVSVEPMGDPATVSGLKAVREKLEWFHNTMEIHSATVAGPYINGDHFAVRFTLDATDKNRNQRSVLDEIALYTVKSGKIVHEMFLFGK